MSRLRAWTQAIRARPGLAAIVCLGLAWGLAMHTMGWAQLAHFAQVRAFAEGQAEIDPWHWETNDKAYYEGHFYSVKSPGVAALTAPLYMAIERAGGLELARDAAAAARESSSPRWEPEQSPRLEYHGFDPALAARVEREVEDGTPVVWVLTLLAAVLPAVLLLVAVRWVVDRIEPGYGTAAAVTLGLGSMLMVFSSELFSHVVAAALGFAAFCVLMRERGGTSSPRALVLAGLLAGLAISFEYQVGLVGVALLFYALARGEDRPRRALAYGAGGVLGVLPAFAFNAWALGDPFEFAYGYAVSVPGLSGHDELGLNSDGFFGITMPRMDAAVDLLVANRGLLVLTPVLVAALAGVVMMRRGRYRAEANLVCAIAAAYFVYNAGYWLTFGGGTPGPRFLVPVLPFLALGLGTAYRRLPALTLALAIPSALFMVAAAISYPLLGQQGPGTWLEFIWIGNLEHTVLTVLGVHSAWVAIAPVLIAVGAAVALAFRATPDTPVGDTRAALTALAAWLPIVVLGPTVAGELNTPLDGDPNLLYLAGIGTLASLAALALLSLRGSGQDLEDDAARALAAPQAQAADGNGGGVVPGGAAEPIGVKDDAPHP